MSWWGKLLGGAFGYLVGGPLGALAGVALGHGFDRGLGRVPLGPALQPGDRERVQAAFFTATFSVMGHIAKADGRVTPEEIRHAEAVIRHMDLSAEMRETAVELFRQGKQPGFDLHGVLEQFRRECHRRHTLLQMFVEIQLQAAYADGAMDPAERRVLKDVCRVLGFPEFVFRQLEALVRAQMGAQEARAGGREGAAMPLSTAYEILNVAESASDAEVKKAYRRLMAQHHPDKLVAKGLPEEMVRVANDRTHEIRRAYDTVKQRRGMR